MLCPPNIELQTFRPVASRYTDKDITALSCVTKYIKLKSVEDNVKMDLKETEYENVDWIILAQDRVRLPVLLYMVIKLRFPQKVWYIFTRLANVIFSKGSVDYYTHNARFCLLLVTAPR